MIWLRRPARVVESGLGFAPKCGEEAVRDEWVRRVRANPRLVDGECWHVLGVHRDGHGGASVHVARTRYRMGAVRGALDTGFTGLGVKAIARWRGRWLVGRRSESCATYPGMWEFAPGGSAEPGEDPSVGIVRELREECALSPMGNPRAVAIIEDSEAGNWELVFEIELEQPPDAPPNWEYSALELAELVMVPEPASPVTAQLVRVAQRCEGRDQEIRRGVR